MDPVPEPYLSPNRDPQVLSGIPPVKVELNLDPELLEIGLYINVTYLTYIFSYTKYGRGFVWDPRAEPRPTPKLRWVQILDLHLCVIFTSLDLSLCEDEDWVKLTVVTRPGYRCTFFGWNGLGAWAWTN